MTIDEIITNYLTANETKKAAEKQEKFYRDLLFDVAKERKVIDTDSFLVTIGLHARETLDTKRLYHDFPDMKKEYGKITEYKQVDSIVKKDAEKAIA